jgi:hypothetical protein
LAVFFFAAFFFAAFFLKAGFPAGFFFALRLAGRFAAARFTDFLRAGAAFLPAFFFAVFFFAAFFFAFAMRASFVSVACCPAVQCNAACDRVVRSR